MDYRKLGSSDLNVSVIGLGTNNFGNPNRIPDPQVSARVIHACIDRGINFIDTADMYGEGKSEEHIGEALRGRRSEVILATKFNFRNLGTESPESRINSSVETSLQKLQTDVIDLYQIHFPTLDVPHQEVMGLLNDLVDSGKVRYIGECNYASWRSAQANHVANEQGGAPFVSSQNYYNLFRRQVELELLPYCTANNIGFLPYFPLAGGWLSGKYQSGAEIGKTARRMVGDLQGDQLAQERLAKLEVWAKERGRTVLDLAFAWLYAHPATTSVIAGAMNPEQVSANAAAADWNLTQQERDEIDAIVAWDGTGEEVEGYGPGGPSVAR